jgi:preprotein translocase subunit SecG
MSALLSFLIILVCVLLILVVLVQNPKGGGLSSTLSSSNQFMGVKKTADFLEKSTWTLVVSLILLCLLYAKVEKSSSKLEVPQSEIQEQIDEEAMPSKQAPAAPVSPATPAPSSAPAN